jgi:hypothetical protein
MFTLIQKLEVRVFHDERSEMGGGPDYSKWPYMGQTSVSRSKTPENSLKIIESPDIFTLPSDPFFQWAFAKIRDNVTVAMMNTVQLNRAMHEIVETGHVKNSSK